MKRNHKLIRIFVLLAAVILMTVPSIALAAPTTAPAGDPVTVVNNLSDYIFSLVRAVGIIGAIWGMVQIGMSISNHDASQRMQGFLILAGCLLIIFSKEILTLIGAM